MSRRADELLMTGSRDQAAFADFVLVAFIRQS
jgi:hypothetical protein